MSIIAYFPSMECTGPIGIGTSVYAAQNGFECAGGPHYKADDPRFTEAYRAPYRANSLFCLLKTNNSFHGVERLSAGTQRRVYIWNLRTKPVESGT